ncbi:MAG: hypothetical protein ACPGWR_15575 [Ardenticatenaceae bacterium]
MFDVHWLVNAKFNAKFIDWSMGWSMQSQCQIHCLVNAKFIAWSMTGEAGGNKLRCLPALFPPAVAPTIRCYWCYFNAPYRAGCCALNG